MNDITPKRADTNQEWTVVHDNTKCALCTVCAKNCPTEALRRDIEGDSLSLFFSSERCDGCAERGTAICETNCPEKAIRRVPNTVFPKADGFALLMKSQMVQCQECDEYFAPARRLDVIASKGIHGHEVERTLCPLCRRAQLVVYLIEQKRVPNSKAEFRSATSIRRKAAKRRAQEQNTVK